MEQVNIEKTNETSPKQPLYVSIYVKLFNMIQDGVFKKGEQLPGENTLSKQFGVSRSTLRQALLILQEDGIIHNIKGKGNYVANNSINNSTGFERLNNPVYSCLKDEYDDIELEVSYETPNEALQKILNLNKSSLVIIFRRIYKLKSEHICFGVACVPYEQVALHNVTLNDAEELQKFVEDTLYEYSSNSHAQVKFTLAGESIAEKLNVEQESTLVHVEEILLSSTGEPTAFMKYYMNPLYCNIFVNRRNIK